MTIPRNRLITTEVEELKLLPGIINILFAQAALNSKTQTIFTPYADGVLISDEDGQLIAKNQRMSIPAVIIITKEENAEEPCYTMSLGNE